jgi:hypothetical protein
VAFWTKRETKREIKWENVEERRANMEQEQDANQPKDMDEHEETLHKGVEDFQDEVTEANEVSVDLETIFLN